MLHFRKLTHPKVVLRRVYGALSSSDETVRIAIVGSGPAAFYTAKYLIEKNTSSNKVIAIDMFEKLPFPYGLVRFGVAPDHPEVKTVTNTFEEVVNKGQNLFRLFANVTIGDKDQQESNHGHSIPLSVLSKHYSAVVLAYGASSDMMLKIPGETAPGVLTSREFVNWYNGHPEHQELHGKLFDLSNIEDVVIIGQGNVALDCARVLTKSADELSATDISSTALEALRNSKVKRVTVIGRRGHVQSAFTIKELRELTRLKGAHVEILPDELALGLTDTSKKELENNRAKKRIIELMNNIAKSTDKSVVSDKVVSIRFLLTPKEITLNEETGRVHALITNRSKLVGDEPFKQKAEVLVNEEIKLPAQLIIESVGYRSTMIDSMIPFDQKRCIVPNKEGRVISDEMINNTIPLYVTGWLKRGATGILGTNIPDARETAGSILSDIENNIINTKPSNIDPIQQIISEQKDGTSLYKDIFNQSISWQEFKQLDLIEQQRGTHKKDIYHQLHSNHHNDDDKKNDNDDSPPRDEQFREKITSITEVLNLLNKH